MPVYLQNTLYYMAIIVLVGGFFFGVALAFRARREAREGVYLTSDADMISDFQRARDAGEMDDAEFRRVRDLLILGKSPQAGEQPDVGPDAETEEQPPVYPTPDRPTPTDPE